MAPGRRRIAALAVVAASAGLALAGCTASPPATPQARTSGPAAVVRPASIDGQTPRQYTEAQAAAMLRAFTPPGARRVSGSPSGDLDNIEEGTTDIDKNLTDEFTEWAAPGFPASVLAQAARHVPAQYRLIGSGTSGAGPGGAQVLEDVFQLAPVPGVLNVRELDVSVVLAETDVTGKPVTGVRVDALVGWVTAGQAYQWIPAAARVMTLTETKLAGNGPSAGPPFAPATVTSATAVQDIAGVINRLSPIPANATFSCPEAFVGSPTVTLTFRAQTGGPELAVASLPTSGCAFVGITVHGKPEAGLLPGDGATDVLWRIQQVTGLDWARIQP
jgi:hypothetical protein